MFEDRTAENILQELLDSITTNVDKRQGSIIYDTLAPQSFLIAKFYQDLSWMIDNILFLDTATGEYLDKKGYELGVPRKSAVTTIRNATFVGATIVDGTRFFTQDGLYWVYNIADNSVTCETAGIIGNSTATGSNLVPVENIQGLTSATIGDIIVPGSEEEDDEEYRQDILTKISEPEKNSNKAQIKKLCLDITGVGKVRVFSLWNGPNTVKGVLIDTEGKPASDTIVNQAQDYIDPGATGLGEGMADLGVIFTAEKAKETPININFNVTRLASGKTLDNARMEAFTAFNDYFKDIAFKQDDVKDTVRYVEIISLIFNLPSVLDFDNLSLNGNVNNIEIELENVATLGNLIVT